VEWLVDFCFLLSAFRFRLFSSDHIRKRLLHLAEIPEAAQAEGGGHKN
jgi:hypothetical protein